MRKKKTRKERQIVTDTELLAMEPDTELEVTMMGASYTRWGPTREVMDDDGVVYMLPRHTALNSVQALPEGQRVRLVFRGTRTSSQGRKYYAWEAYAQD